MGFSFKIHICLKGSTKRPGPDHWVTMDTVFQRIQPSEYYRRFLEYQIRPDGRHPAGVRDVRIMKGVLKDVTVGSSIVSAGHSRFIAGVTAEIAPPHPLEPRSGKIVVNVEFPRSSGADGSHNASEDSSSIAATASVSICQIFSSPKVVDLTQFCIKEGKAVWVLYVNVICLEYDGNVIDWSLCAVAAALQDTVLPAIEWDSQQQWWRIVDNHESEEQQIQKNDSESYCSSQSVRLIGRPSSVTFSRLLDKYWLVDPTQDECQLGDSLTIWRSSTQSDLHLLRSSGEGVDITGLLHTLFEKSRSGMEAMDAAIEKAVNADEAAIWEVCYSDDGDEDSVM